MSENIFIKVANDFFDIIFKTAAWIFMIVVVLPVYLFVTMVVHPNVEYEIGEPTIERIHEFIKTHPKHMEWTLANNKLWGTHYTDKVINEMTKGKTGIKKWSELLENHNWKNRIPELDWDTATFMADMMKGRYGRDIYASYLGGLDMRDFHTSNWDEFRETGKDYMLWNFEDE
jgi:hypothetical protein